MSLQLKSAVDERGGEGVIYICDSKKLAISVLVMYLSKLSTHGRNIQPLLNQLAKNPTSEELEKFRWGSELPTPAESAGNIVQVSELCLYWVISMLSKHFDIS